MNLARARAAPAIAFTALAAALLLASCSTDSGSPAGSAGPGSSSASNAGSSPLPPPSFGPPPSPTAPDDTTPVTIDPALLQLLPEAVDGFPLEEDLDIAAEALSDTATLRLGTAVDVAVAVDAGNGNLVTGWVIRLRSGALTPDAFSQWRDSYDEAACAASGDGVVGRAEAQIGGRTAYVTSCVTGLRTYHVWLEAQNVLISASAIGDGRFGEKLLEGLRVPA